VEKKESIITNDREALKSIERKLGLVQRDLERAKNRMSRRHLRESINDLKIELGWSFLDRGEYEEGFVLYHTIPWTTHGEAKCNGIARALTEMGYYDEARRLLEVGLRKLPKSYALWVAMGAWHDSLGEDFESLKCMEIALRFAPAGRPTYGITQPSAGRQSLKKDQRA
jgi:tetratricopeptide (TPR) repeat protein